MSNKLKKQAGFSAVEFLIILVVVGIIAFAGYMVMQNQSDSYTDTRTNTSEIEEASDIENTEDLQNAENTLNDVNFDDLDTTELEEAEAELL